MRAGDVYTHTYHGYPSSIVDPSTRLLWSDVTDAQSRGVYFDVGHGQGSFSWTVAEIATQQGFWPDMLGTDLHIGNYEGPAYDMPTVMSKFLYLGRVCLLLSFLYFFCLCCNFNHHRRQQI